MIYYIFIIQAVEPSLDASPFLSRFHCSRPSLTLKGAITTRLVGVANVDSCIPVDNDASRMGQAWPFEATAPKGHHDAIAQPEEEARCSSQARGRTVCTALGPPEDSEVTPARIAMHHPIFSSRGEEESACIVPSLLEGWFSKRIQGSIGFD